MAAEEGKKKATNKKRKQSEVVQEPSKSSTAPLNRLNSHNIANATVKPMEKGELSESCTYSNRRKKIFPPHCANSETYDVRPWGLLGAGYSDS